MTLSLPMDSVSAAVRLADAQGLQWQPGQVGEATAHGEIFASGDEGAGAALALALALDRQRAVRAGPSADPLADTPDERMWLWVQDARAIQRSGRPYRAGLPEGLRHRLIHVAVKTAQDALFALEEGLRCRDLAFVIGEITGNPRALDMTASRRLGLAAERHGVPLWLVRLDARRDLSSARMRWEVASAPSPAPGWNAQAPGTQSWQAELFRARRHPPGQWILREDGRLVAEKVGAAAELQRRREGGAKPRPG
ncbi:hypothetical protein [Novosphingobium profundi]|uniref:hypothetical protein n=1 Tax=Novosphingobium profundi TaxID=1774954 RepID=UPI001FE93A5C|nr:hypothetical protein [Novosphingobium profundi]